jgi:hypothetical protein
MIVEKRVLVEVKAARRIHRDIALKFATIFERLVSRWA